jgi:hypothetical protein
VRQVSLVKAKKAPDEEVMMMLVNDVVVENSEAP